MLGGERNDHEVMPVMTPEKTLRALMLMLRSPFMHGFWRVVAYRVSRQARFSLYRLAEDGELAGAAMLSESVLEPQP